MHGQRDEIKPLPSLRSHVSFGQRSDGRGRGIVEEGFDLALRAGRLDDSSLIARRVGITEAPLFASPAYIERVGAPCKVTHLPKHNYVMFRPRHGELELLLDGPKGQERVTVKGSIGVDDFSFVRRAVLAGIGVGLLPWVYCRAESRPALWSEAFRNTSGAAPGCTSPISPVATSPNASRSDATVS